MNHSLKFVLADASSYARVAAAFPQGGAPLLLMEDSFLDTDDGLLSRNSIMLRVRRIVAARGSGPDAPAPTAEVRAMQHSTVTDGCAQRWDTSAPIDPAVAERLYLLPGAEPVVLAELFDRLLSCCGAFLERIVSAATGQPAPPVCRFVRLGGYRTLRDARPWPACVSQPGLQLRIDHTTYAFGERFEVEVADITVPVQDVVDELAQTLERAGARFTLGHETKWQVMMAARDSGRVKNTMAVAAKMELATLQDFATVRRSLGGAAPESEADEPFGELQENYFFDDAQGTLRRRHNIVFRLRVLPQSGKAFVTIKNNEPVTGGSAVSWMQQEPVPVEVVEAALRDPMSFFLHPSAAAEKVQALLSGDGAGGSGNSSMPGVMQMSLSQQNAAMQQRSPSKARPGTSGPAGDFPLLVFIGGYRNRRESFTWPGCQSQPGLTLHLDRTSYPFGERYEVEVPGITVPVHDVVSELADVLSSLGVRFRPATQDKVETMLTGGGGGGGGNNRRVAAGANDGEEEGNLF
jgi:hypothetical protein